MGRKGKDYITASPEETERLGAKLAHLLAAGDIIGLTGELGAGKTCFVAGLAKGLNVPEGSYVSSPSFTILKVYKGDKDIYHFDFYRIEDPAEFEALGFDDYLMLGGIVVIEWADRFKDLLPKEMMTLDFSLIDEKRRRIAIPAQLSKRLTL